VSSIEERLKRLEEIVQTLWDIHCLENNVDYHNLFAEEEEQQYPEEDWREEFPIFPDTCETCYYFFGENCEGCDNYTQENEYYSEEYCPNCPDKLEPSTTKVTIWNDDKTDFVTIEFPSAEAALKFTQANA
jgi:hypothetical protein